MRAASDPDSAIEIVALSKRFGATFALRDLSMSVPRGGVFGFLGPNGAGKTTAIKCLLGLTFPSSGGGLVLGRPFGDRRARSRIGYLPELFRYQSWLEAREVLALHARLSRLDRRDDTRTFAAALDRVGLRRHERERVGGFSKGMQQRLGLAVALLGKPELVILDEPTSALDPLGRRDVRAIIERLRDEGVTVLLNSHLLSEVERICDRFVVIDGGRVAGSGTVADLGRFGSELRLQLAQSDRATHEIDTLLGPYGPVTRGGGAIRIAGVARESVPEIVALLVRHGVALYGVELHAATLEESFVALLEGAHAHRDDRCTNVR